jgi:hypothetical protein
MSKKSNATKQARRGCPNKRKRPNPGIRYPNFMLASPVPLGMGMQLGGGLDLGFVEDQAMRMLVCEQARKMGYRKAYLALVAGEVLLKSIPASGVDKAFEKLMAEDAAKLGGVQ